MWYSEWDEQQYGAQGYGIPPWYIDWTGTGVIVHFDNNNVNDNASPYWAYVNQGNAFADSLYFFWGQDLQYNFVDSLTTIGHRNGAAVVATIMQVDATHLHNLITDSVKIETFCKAVAQWCERHNYDGIDFNYENGAGTGHAARSDLGRFFRRLRYNLNTYVTTYLSSLSRPWFSVCSPWEWTIGGNPAYSPGDTVYIDMFNLQQGTLEWEADYNGNRTWYGIAVKLGTRGEGYAYAQANSIWIPTLSEDPSWISSGNKPRGIRAAVNVGFPKSRIAPAFGLGGGAIKRGADTAVSLYSSVTADLKRCDLDDLIAHGGRWYYDTAYQASSVRGTATASIGWPCNVSPGQKFFVAAADSQNAYKATDWLFKNGYGGIAPYSVSFDVETTVPAGAPFSDWWKRLPGHSGIFKAMVDNGSLLPSPTLNITPSLLSFGNVVVSTISGEQTCTLSGSNLTPASDSITITASTGFQVSKSTGTGFTSSIKVGYTGGALSARTVYIRFVPTWYKVTVRT